MRLGVVGTAWITDALLKAIKDIKDIELISVTSPRKESTDKFKERYGFAEGYNDFDEMINKSKLDVLYVASPNAFHFDQTKKALSRGINVLCEKPITLAIDELNELKRVAIENGTYFIEAMRIVHHPHTKVLKDSLKRLDGLQYANLKFMRYSSRYDAYKAGLRPNVFLKEYGGGALNDLGVYPITTAVVLFGYPEKITSEMVMLDTGVDATTSAILQYDGFQVNITVSKVSNTYSYNEIQGESNSILLSHVTHLDKIILKDDDNEEVIVDHQVEDDMKYEMECLLNIIKNKDDKEFNKLFDITMSVTKICDEIRK